MLGLGTYKIPKSPLKTIWADSKQGCSNIRGTIHLYSFWQILGLNRTGHMIVQPRQDRQPEFAGRVLPDRTKSGPVFFPST